MCVTSGIDGTHCLPVLVVTCEALSGSVLNVCVSPVVSIVHTVYLWRLLPVRFVGKCVECLHVTSSFDSTHCLPVVVVSCEAVRKCV